MVFVNTKAFVERVARALERSGYRVGVLSGDVPQKKRESLLKKFQAGQLEILVATDVAARGLHIDGVSHVYNYDLPFDAEDYVHRIGRTARLGAEGDAISFACERYAQSLPDIEAYIEQKIPVEPVTAELLVSLPRKPREGVEMAAEDGESVSAIFKEAREQRAADDARRGIAPRGGRSGAGPGRGPRTGSGSGTTAGSASDESRRGPRPPRPPRKVEEGTPVAAVAMPAAITAGAVPTAADADRAPRKRRRRRGGRKLEGAEAMPQVQPVNPPVQRQKPTAQVVATRAPAKPGAATEPSLLSRIGHGLRKLVKRAPRTQH
jgi:ATP-dependent RNA helicase RhlB